MSVIAMPHDTVDALSRGPGLRPGCLVPGFLQFVSHLLRPPSHDIDESPQTLAAALHVRHALAAHYDPAVKPRAPDREDDVSALDILQALDFRFLARAVHAWRINEIDVAAL